MAPSERERCLIVNADDFGLTSGINRGIVEVHKRGIVTSASLMVRYEAAEEAARYASAHPELSVGLHFEAGEWRYADGAWYPAYQVVDADNADEVSAELDRQLVAFRRLLGRAPTHLDSHQHVHQSEPARAILLHRAEQIGIPLRSCSPGVTYVGSFYGQTGEGEPFPEGISLERLEVMIGELAGGWTEFGCHPGYAAELDSVYTAEREAELRVLCRESLRDILRQRDIQLRSFHDLPRGL